MNRFTTCLIAASLIAGAGEICAQESQMPSMAYGIRVYSANAASMSLVSFPVDNPSEEEELFDLSDYNIMAATCHDNVYYFIHSDDGVLGSKFVTLNMNTMDTKVVATYDWKADLAGNIIYSDLAFDPTSNMIYAAGYNMDEMTTGEDMNDIYAPFAIFTIDPATGNATLVGEQDEHVLVSIMIDSEGSLLGIDEGGVLWEVSKWAGYLNYDLLDFGVTPVGIQSMAHDFGKGVSYWASYSSGSSGNGVSQLIKFVRTPDWEYEYEVIGKVGSDSEIIGLYIDSDPLPKGAPAVVEDLVVTPGASGAPTAEITWKNPSKNIGGDAIGKVDIIIYRDDAAVKTLQGLEAGAAGAWTDTYVPVGNHTYSLSASNEIAEGRKTFAHEMWIGEDTPGAPAVSAAADESGKSVSVSWAAPAKGSHGGWYNAGEVVYTVKRLPDGAVLLENTTATSFTDNGIDELHGYRYEVTASTSAGKGDTGVSDPVVAGNPHQLPFAADFNDEDQINQWKSFNLDGDEYSWYVYKTGWAGTYDNFFRYNPETVLNPETPVDDWLISPPVALESGKLYVVKYDLRLLGTLFPANTTLAMGNTQAPAAMTTILTENDGEVNDIEWITHSVPFTVDESGSCCFGYQIRNAVPVQFYKFEVREVAETDMSAGSIHGNTLANTGTESVYQVELSNSGFNAIDAFTVELVDEDGNVVASCDYTDNIPSQETITVEVAWTPEKEGVITIRPRVKVEGDCEPGNDLGEEFSVTVFGSGEMLHIRDGRTGTGYAPFYGTYLHSAVQTIYPAERMGNYTDADIKAIVYYVYTAMGQTASSIDFEVALACVDKDDFADNTMIDEEQLSKVYEGQLRIDPDNKTVSIMFDTPFHYTGGNLCVFTRHASETMTPVFFEAEYSTSDPLYHTCLYRGFDRFDFSQTPNGCYRDLPNVSFLMADHSGVNAAAAERNNIAIGYSPENGITVEGDYDACQIYSASGVLIGEYHGKHTIPVHYEGILVVRVVSGTECVVKKIATTR